MEHKSVKKLFWLYRNGVGPSLYTFLPASDVLSLVTSTYSSDPSKLSSSNGSKILVVIPDTGKYKVSDPSVRGEPRE